VPNAVPPGYHTLRIEGPRFTAQSMVIAAPSRCPQPERSWGTFIPLHALRRETGDWGVGSFRDLQDLGAWTSTMGGAYVGTLPVLAPYIDSSGGYAGPYLPASKLAWNEAHIDIASLPEMRSDDRWADEARAAITSPAFDTELSLIRDLDSADVARVLQLKRPILELLATSLSRSDNPRRRAFEEFVTASDHLLAYARFRATCDSLGTSWQNWPSRAVHEVAGSWMADEAIRHHLYAQWTADTQLAEQANAGLYLDMPVGVHSSGFDTWFNPECFAQGASGGAPPDSFFAEGQSWGFPPLHPEGIRKQGYGYVISYLRHVMSRASVVRADHVMGMHRLYWVPDGFDARNGAYVRYHSDELHAIVTLEALRSDTVVVGEDLGTVPKTVRSDMARDGMLRSFVMQFESTERDPLPEPDKHSLATFGTHDLPTFLAYWNGNDIEEQAAFGHIDSARAEEDKTKRKRWRASVLEALRAPEEAHGADEPLSALRGILDHMGRSDALVVQVDLEDLWLEPNQQNHPGTASSLNFKRRASLTFEDMVEDPDVLDTLRRLETARGEGAAIPAGKGTT
jgi:4-alpha-glucanotransferase